MRLTLSAPLLLAALGTTSAFVVTPTGPSLLSTTSAREHGTAQVVLQMADAAAATETETKPKKRGPASPKELLARARRNAGLPEDDDEPPKLFDDAVLDDFQSCLLKLEKRVKEGPGSLSAMEVAEFESETGRILADMDEKLKAGDEGSTPATTTKAAAAVEAPPVESATPPPPPPPPAAAAADPEPVEEKIIDTSNDEGPAYTGKGGLGLASGTRNTWIIPGMDEMTAEEYQQALQKSVSERQERRRKEMRGTVGNRAGNSYLDTLGGGTNAATAGLAGGSITERDEEFESRPDLYDA